MPDAQTAAMQAQQVAYYNSQQAYAVQLGQIAAQQWAQYQMTYQAPIVVSPVPVQVGLKRPADPLALPLAKLSKVDDPSVMVLKASTDPAKSAAYLKNSLVSGRTMTVLTTDAQTLGVAIRALGYCRLFLQVSPLSHILPLCVSSISRLCHLHVTSMSHRCLSYLGSCLLGCVRSVRYWSCVWLRICTVSTHCTTVDSLAAEASLPAALA